MQHLNFDLAGYTSLLLVFFILFFLIKKKPYLTKILIFFFFIRSILSILNVEVIALPDAGSDAKNFINIASDLSKNGFIENILNPQLGPLFRNTYPWFLSLFFSLVGESYLLAMTVNLLLSMLTVYYLDSLAKLLWGNFNFNKRLFLITLLPSFVLYGILPLREASFVFCLLIGILNAGLFIKYNFKKNFLISIIFFSLTGMIHGGGFVALLLFSFYFFFKNLKFFFITLFKKKINFFNIILLLTSFTFLFLYLSGIVSFSKIGSIYNLFDLDYIKKFTNVRSFGTAAYPNFLTINSILDIIWKIPLRFCYFLFGPFIWDLKLPIHLLGTIESLIFLYLFLKIVRSFNVIKKNNLAFLLFMLLLIMTLIFSIGTSNFGTGYRHRAKFFIFIASLVVPSLKKRRFN